MCKIRNFVAEFYSLESKKLPKLWGVKFDRGKKIYCLFYCKYFKFITTCEH